MSDYETIKDAILKLAAVVNNPYNDGFLQFESKKDIWRLKYWIDFKLKQMPEFSGERDWLKELEKSKVWEILKE